MSSVDYEEQVETLTKWCKRHNKKPSIFEMFDYSPLAFLLWPELPILVPDIDASKEPLKDVFDQCELCGRPFTPENLHLDEFKTVTSKVVLEDCQEVHGNPLKDNSLMVCFDEDEMSGNCIGKCSEHSVSEVEISSSPLKYEENINKDKQSDKIRNRVTFGACVDVTSDFLTKVESSESEEEVKVSRGKGKLQINNKTGLETNEDFVTDNDEDSSDEKSKKSKARCWTIQRKKDN